MESYDRWHSLKNVNYYSYPRIPTHPVHNSLVILYRYAGVLIHGKPDRKILDLLGYLTRTEFSDHCAQLVTTVGGFSNSSGSSLGPVVVTRLASLTNVPSLLDIWSIEWIQSGVDDWLLTMCPACYKTVGGFSNSSGSSLGLLKTVGGQLSDPVWSVVVTRLVSTTVPSLLQDSWWVLQLEWIQSRLVVVRLASLTTVPSCYKTVGGFNSSGSTGFSDHCAQLVTTVGGFSNSSGSSLGSVVVTRLASLTTVPSLLDSWWVLQLEWIQSRTVGGFSNSSGSSLGSVVVTRQASLTTVPGLLQDSWWELQLEWTSLGSVVVTRLASLTTVPACYKTVGFSNSVDQSRLVTRQLVGSPTRGSSLGSVVVTRLASLTTVPSLLDSWWVLQLEWIQSRTVGGFSNSSGSSLGSVVVTRLASLTTVPGLLQDSWWELQLEWTSLGSVVVTRLASLTTVPSLLQDSWWVLQLEWIQSRFTCYKTVGGNSNSSGSSLGSVVVTRMASLTTVTRLLQDSWWVLQLEWIQMASLTNVPNLLDSWWELQLEWTSLGSVVVTRLASLTNVPSLLDSWWELQLEWIQSRLDELENIYQLHFQQDGASSHFSALVTDALNERFGDGWIGRQGVQT
ncbi:hypothetical protein J6590_086279 [Homalodisca vitripennis]|nr:hypothetical protein J6590_086279 [Homalodisca vitripennis]